MIAKVLDSGFWPVATGYMRRQCQGRDRTGDTWIFSSIVPNPRWEGTYQKETAVLANLPLNGVIGVKPECPSQFCGDTGRVFKNKGKATGIEINTYEDSPAMRSS